jgi:hypothetical protein
LPTGCLALSQLQADELHTIEEARYHRRRSLNQNANKHRANCNQLQLKKSRGFVKPTCRDFLNFFVNSQESCRSFVSNVDNGAHKLPSTTPHEMERLL